jgi:hypothetical protein
MFKKNSTPKLEYVATISKALNVPQGELLEPGINRENLTPVQLELIDVLSDQDEQMIRRLIPIVKGIILAEREKQ